MLNCVPIQTFFEIGLRKFCFGCRINPLLLYKTKEVSNFFICDRHCHFLNIPEQGWRVPDKCICGTRDFGWLHWRTPSLSPCQRPELCISANGCAANAMTSTWPMRWRPGWMCRKSHCHNKIKVDYHSFSTRRQHRVPKGKPAWWGIFDFGAFFVVFDL